MPNPRTPWLASLSPRIALGAGLILVPGLAKGRADGKRPFTVDDDIACAYFGDPYSGGVQPITLSPDEKWAAVHTERGLVAENRVQDELRVYDLELLRRFVNAAGENSASEPLWRLAESTSKEGLIISDITWLPDSRRLAFLVKTKIETRQLWLAEPLTGTASPLTAEGQDVVAFDVKDGTHFAYTVRNPGPSVGKTDPGTVSGFSATGMPVYNLMGSSSAIELRFSRRSELWAACGGAPRKVLDPASGKPLILYGDSTVALAPNGRMAALVLPIEDIPADWRRRFLPLPRFKNEVVMAGHQDLDDPSGPLYVSVFAVVDLGTGVVSRLVAAPTAASARWVTLGHLDWSADSKAVLLPGTFIPEREGLSPCVAVAWLATGRIECVVPLANEKREYVSVTRFEPGRSDLLVVESNVVAPHIVKIYSRGLDGRWELETTAPESLRSGAATDLTIKQSFRDRPILTATDPATRKSRVIWDPNPQLDGVELGETSVYRWREPSGREWSGGLFKPPGFVAGRRYPLVIQTHGFAQDQFRPSGIYPTGFAARELAAAGILVLQAPDLPSAYSGEPDEGPAHLRGYAAAVQQLVAEGVVDPDRVGMIGFSRTCLYTMQALTVQKLFRLRAASIIDGTNAGYFQYVLLADFSGNIHERDEESLIGAPPFGAGLQRWLEQSPEFNLDKVTAPLQIVADRGTNAVFNWEPYAMLRMLRKPVDLVVLNTAQHILTNPGARLVAQGGTVDWFRFWLKDEEDPDPAKAAQYLRWRKLRELQAADPKVTPEASP
jgi:dipeptidyl aminopeptidase/acylaminoacyl peptidase